MLILAPYLVVDKYTLSIKLPIKFE